MAAHVLSYRIGRRRQKSPSRCIFSADDLRSHRPQKVENADARRASADRLPSRWLHGKHEHSARFASQAPVAGSNQALRAWRGKQDRLQPVDHIDRAAFMNREVAVATSLLWASSSSSLASPQMEKQTISQNLQRAPRRRLAAGPEAGPSGDINADRDRAIDLEVRWSRHFTMPLPVLRLRSDAAVESAAAPRAARAS